MVKMTIYVLINLSKEKGDAAFLEIPNDKLKEMFEDKVKPYLIPESSLVDNNGNPVQ